MAATPPTEATERLSREALDERLASLPGFARLPAASRQRVAAIGEPRLCRTGEHLIRQGEVHRAILVLLGGRLKMTRDLSKGRSALLALFGAGDTIGLSLLGGQPSAASLVAIESTLILRLDGARLLAAMTEMPQLLGDLLPLLTERVAECRNCAVEGTFLRVEPRFARLFLRLGASVGATQGSATFIPVPLSRQDLADMAGTTIETSIRILSRWGKEGIVETRDDGFLLHDAASLRAICGD